MPLPDLEHGALLGQCRTNELEAAGSPIGLGVDGSASNDSSNLIELRSALGAVLMHVKGFGAPETGSAFARALELWERLGSPLEFLHIPYGQSRYYAACGKFDLATPLDQDLLRLSRQHNDIRGLVLSHLTSGRNLGMVGRFASSRKHLEEVLALYDPTSLTARLSIKPDSTLV